MRIIAGKLKGRKLTAVQGLHTRPTADRVREALFNILGRKTMDANVLDLYAGTGALGIEALSRGARSAVFVDHAQQALTLAQKSGALRRATDRPGYPMGYHQKPELPDRIRQYL